MFSFLMILNCYLILLYTFLNVNLKRHQAVVVRRIVGAAHGAKTKPVRFHAVGTDVPPKDALLVTPVRC